MRNLLTMNNKLYIPKNDFRYDDYIDYIYVLVYRKSYELIRYDESVMEMKQKGKRFLTYRIVDRQSGCLVMQKGNVEYYQYYDDGYWYKTTRFVASKSESMTVGKIIHPIERGL